jgi:hypothetical protein
MKYTLAMCLALSLPAASMDHDELQRQRAEYEKLKQEALEKMENDVNAAIRASLGEYHSPRPPHREILPTHTPHTSFENFDGDEVLQAAFRESLQMSYQQEPQTAEDECLAQQLYEEGISFHAASSTSEPYSFIDPASAELIRQIEEEDASYDESASAALIYQLQSMDLSEAYGRETPPLSVRARFTKIVPIEARNDFNQMKKEILAIYKGHGANVHSGDIFIPNNASKLLAIASLFDDHLSQQSRAIHEQNLLQQQDQLLQLITPYSSRLDKYAYKDTDRNIHKNYKEITDIIKSQFTRSNNEINSYASGQGTIIWARFMALAAERLKDPYTSEEVKNTIAMILAEKAIEGMLTQGGCIQGFVNRGFIGLLTILGFDLSDHGEDSRFQSA